MLFSENSIKSLAAGLNEYHREKSMESSGELEHAEKALKGIDEKIGKIVRLVTESGISIETVKADLKRLEDSKRFQEERIRTINLAHNAAIVSEEAIGELICRSREFVKTRNIPECRNFIDTYIERVIVHKDRVEVIFKFEAPDSQREHLLPLKSGDRTKSLKEEYRHAV